MVVRNQASYSSYSFNVLIFLIFFFFFHFLKAFYYPPNVGYNIGTEDSPNSYMLEIHYDNPKGIEGHYVHLFIFLKKSQKTLLVSFAACLWLYGYFLQLAMILSFLGNS